MERICSNCQYVDKFEPRQDEIERGLLLGCRYPGWEHYVQEEEASRCHTFVERKKEGLNENTY